MCVVVIIQVAVCFFFFSIPPALTHCESLRYLISTCVSPTPNMFFHSRRKTILRTFSWTGLYSLLKNGSLDSPRPLGRCCVTKHFALTTLSSSDATKDHSPTPHFVSSCCHANTTELWASCHRSPQSAETSLGCLGRATYWESDSLETLMTSLSGSRFICWML